MFLIILFLLSAFGRYFVISVYLLLLRVVHMTKMRLVKY